MVSTVETVIAMGVTTILKMNLLGKKLLPPYWKGILMLSDLRFLTYPKIKPVLVRGMLLSKITTLELSIA